MLNLKWWLLFWDINKVKTRRDDNGTDYGADSIFIVGRADERGCFPLSFFKVNNKLYTLARIFFYPFFYVFLFKLNKNLYNPTLNLFLLSLFKLNNNLCSPSQRLKDWEQKRIYSKNWWLDPSRAPSQTEFNNMIFPHYHILVDKMCSYRIRK